MRPLHYPAISRAGWDQYTQIRREYIFTAGQVRLQGNLASRDEKTKNKADYVLFYQSNLPLAVVEAKNNHHSVGRGMPQALGYAEALMCRLCFHRTATPSCSTTVPAGPPHRKAT